MVELIDYLIIVEFNKKFFFYTIEIEKCSGKKERNEVQRKKNRTERGDVYRTKVEDILSTVCTFERKTGEKEDIYSSRKRYRVQMKERTGKHAREKVKKKEE